MHITKCEAGYPYILKNQNGQNLKEIGIQKNCKCIFDTFHWNHWIYWCEFPDYWNEINGIDSLVNDIGDNWNNFHPNYDNYSISISDDHKYWLNSKVDWQKNELISILDQKLFKYNREKDILMKQVIF